MLSYPKKFVSKTQLCIVPLIVIMIITIQTFYFEYPVEWKLTKIGVNGFKGPFIIVNVKKKSRFFRNCGWVGQKKELKIKIHFFIFLF